MGRSEGSRHVQPRRVQPRRVQPLCGAAGLLVCLLLTGGTGCSVIRNEFRTVIGEPIRYGPRIDHRKTKRHHQRLAQRTWEQFLQIHPGVPRSEDFRDGFVEGFADYVTYGGDGAPPLLPPRHYWNLSHRDPNGRARVTQWFEGFAAGVEVARQSGLRELQTVPSSLWGGPRHELAPFDAASAAGDTFPEEIPLPDIAPPARLPTEELGPPNRQTPRTDRESLPVPNSTEDPADDASREASAVARWLELPRPESPAESPPAAGE